MEISYLNEEQAYEALHNRDAELWWDGSGARVVIWGSPTMWVEPSAAMGLVRRLKQVIGEPPISVQKWKREG